MIEWVEETYPCFVTQAQSVKRSYSKHLAIWCPCYRCDRVIMNKTAVEHTAIAVPHLKNTGMREYTNTENIWQQRVYKYMLVQGISKIR